MNKTQLITILQACLLSFEGISLNELINEYRINPILAKVGVDLCEFLKPKELSNETSEKDDDKFFSKEDNNEILSEEDKKIWRNLKND